MADFETATETLAGPLDAIHHVGRAVSWWLTPSPQGWSFTVAGSNWVRASEPFATAYEAQRRALAVLAECR